MNRVIKFRVWHFPTNQYYYTSTPSCSFLAETMPDGGDSLCYLPRPNENFIPGKLGRHISESNPENVVFEQFTGLVDKNGKEIWEGDIVRWIPGSQTNWVVKFKTYFDGDSGYEHIGFCLESDDSNLGSIFDTFPIEVVGNINQNPELLK